MKRISYLETCHPRNLLSGIHAFVLRLDSRLRGNDSEVVSLHASRFTRCVCFIVLLFSLHASHFTFHAQAALENGMEAEIVMGQPDFTSATGGVNRAKFFFPVGVTVQRDRVILADFFVSRRVLIWNFIPKVNGALADVVVGKPDFDTVVIATSRIVTNQPSDVDVSGNKLLICDRGASRVLIYDGIPETNNEPADIVIGQSNFAASGAATSQTGFSLPRSLATDGKRIYVSDTGNNRIMVFNLFPTSSGAAADLVLGQISFTTNNAGAGENQLSAPRGIWSDGKKLIVSDTGNHRLLIWNSIPTSGGQAADVVVGQPDFGLGTAGTSRARLNAPDQITSDGKRLFVADRTNHRVLVWSEIPTKNGTPADYVLGQPDFTTAVAATTKTGMNAPSGVSYYGDKLFVVDGGSHRILIFNLMGSNQVELGPQFSQGKAVVGKVFWDFDGDGRQDGGIS